MTVMKRMLLYAVYATLRQLFRCLSILKYVSDISLIRAFATIVNQRKKNMNVNIQAIRDAASDLLETVSSADYFQSLKVSHQCHAFNIAVKQQAPVIALRSLDWAIGLKADGQLTVDEISALWTLSDLCCKLSDMAEDSLQQDEFEYIIELLQPLAIQVSTVGVTSVLVS